MVFSRPHLLLCDIKMSGFTAREQRALESGEMLIPSLHSELFLHKTRHWLQQQLQEGAGTSPLSPEHWNSSAGGLCSLSLLNKMGDEKLRAHWYILLGLRNKAKQKSEPKPPSFHPCLAMKVPSYFQAL